MRTLALLTLLISAADHWTTYLCLRERIAGWDVTEVNPIADWLFQTIGLVPGLLMDSAITVAAVGFLVLTRAVPQAAKFVFFTLVIAATSFAVINNLRAVEALGLERHGLPRATARRKVVHVGGGHGADDLEAADARISQAAIRPLVEDRREGHGSGGEAWGGAAGEGRAASTAVSVEKRECGLHEESGDSDWQI